MNMVAFKSTWRNSSKPIDILIYHILSKMSMANCYKLFWWLLLMALLLYWRRMTTETASALCSSFPNLSGKVMYTSNTMESLKRLPPLNRGRTVSPNAMTLTKALYLVTAECDSIAVAFQEAPKGSLTRWTDDLGHFGDRNKLFAFAWGMCKLRGSKAARAVEKPV